MKATQKLRVEQAADAVVAYIESHDLVEGDRLPNEMALADYADVSRGTLREAVRMLVSVDALEVRHGSGTYVGPGPTDQENPFGFGRIKNPLSLVRDLFEVRYLVEPTMTARAARNAKPEDIQALEELADKIEASIHQESLDHLDYDVQFHSLIAKASGNIAFDQMLPIIYESIVLYNKNYTTDHIKKETIISHREIIKAIKSRDELAAYDAAMIHIVNNRRSLLKKKL